MPETLIRRREERSTSTSVPGLGDLDEGMDAIQEEEAAEQAAAESEIEAEMAADAELEDDVLEDVVEDEDEDEDEDEEDESEVALSFTPGVPEPPRKAPPRRRAPPRSQTRSRSRKPLFSEEIADDLANVLAGINYEPGNHKISVYRVEPEYHPDTGGRIVGLCKTYNRRISPDDIQKEFGGGKYKLLVMGPRASTGRGSEIKAKFEIEIVGPPIVPMSEQQKKKLEREEEKKQEELLDRILERQEKRDAEAKRELREMNQTMFQMMEKAFNKPQADPQQAVIATMTPMLTMMKEDTARRDRELEEQRRRDDERRREDEQRRRDEREEANRRHEAEMRRQDQQAAVQMEQLKMQQEAMKQQMQVETQNSKQQMEMMLKFMQKTDAEKESRAKEQTTLQMQVMSQISDLQRTSMETQLKLLSDQLNEAKNKDGFLETMEKYSMINGLLNPGEPDKDTWEKVADRVGDFIPGVVTGLSALRGGPAPAPTAALPPGRMIPGSVAVVENVDGVQPGVPVQSHPSPMGGQPHAPQLAAPIPFYEGEPEGAQVETPEEGPEMEMSVNDFKEFMAYPNQGSNEEVLTFLVKNLDLGMQRGMEADAIFAKCIATLPLAQKNFLKMLPIDSLMAFVDANVPSSWALRSIDGDMKLRAVHEKLVTSA